MNPALRLTPSTSPFFRNSLPRSPTRPVKEEPGLHLTKVIGTTAASANAFDCLPATRQFTFTAGAAAVLATVDEDLNITQQFFRACPGSSPTTGTAWPLTPNPPDARSRALGNLKEHGLGASPLGASTRDWGDSPSGRSTTAKDRVKTATSVALSPNGKWLAIGETGYKPRVLLFSIRDGSSENPVLTLAEHSFGVHALSFSPDSRFLASLGTVNDGFLYVWSIDDRTGTATLHSSNKCTTYIHTMCWMGLRIITAGLRYVKVWRPCDEAATLDVRSNDSPRGTLTPRPKNDSRSFDFGNSIMSPKHRVLGGKNSLLGDLLDATFVVALPISESKALLCTESGDVCLLDDTDRTQTMTLARQAGMRISAARLDDALEVLHVLGAGERSVSFRVDELQDRASSPENGTRRQVTSPSKTSTPVNSTVVAGTIPGVVIEVKSNRMINLIKVDADLGPATSRQLAAHEHPVLGVRSLQSSLVPEAELLTFSSDGRVHFWDRDGHSVGEPMAIPVPSSSEMYGLPNELRAVVPLSNGMLAAADRYGTLTILHPITGEVAHQARAHAAEALDLIAFERDGVQLLASASRDRTVQLFSYTSDTHALDLLQTMDEHAAAVTGLLVTRDSNQLLSSSADRSIVIREALLRSPSDSCSVAYVMLRTLTLKSAPTSFCLGAEDDTILVATTDRCISKHCTKSTGAQQQATFSFKCSDCDGGEAVVMSKIIYAPSLNGNPTIAGVSSSDKSVRLYSEFGQLVARDWGHTEGITDMALISRVSERDAPHASPAIVTVAADSTIFLWESLVANTGNGSRPASSDTTTGATADAAPLAPPLRKVISYSEMSKFRRERSGDGAEAEPPSPTSSSFAASTLTASPQRLRKKTSRISMASAPRLEPSAFVGSRNADSAGRRRSTRHRSPSPPSPRNLERVRRERATDGGTGRRTSMGVGPPPGMGGRSKSTENVPRSAAVSGNGASASAGTSAISVGTLTASTESLSRSLRAYRRKLTGSVSSTASSRPDSASVSPETLREFEKELKLTVRAVAERLSTSLSVSQDPASAVAGKSKAADEALMARLLETAGEKLVGLLDGRIQARVESEVRKSSGELAFMTAGGSGLKTPIEVDEDDAEGGAHASFGAVREE